MNLSEYLKVVNAGGPGSGCHGPNCGRKGGGGSTFPSDYESRRREQLKEHAELVKKAALAAPRSDEAKSARAAVKESESKLVHPDDGEFKADPNNPGSRASRTWTSPSGDTVTRNVTPDYPIYRVKGSTRVSYEGHDGVGFDKRFSGANHQQNASKYLDKHFGIKPIAFPQVQARD